MGLWPASLAPPPREVCKPQPEGEKNLGTFGWYRMLSASTLPEPAAPHVPGHLLYHT